MAQINTQQASPVAQDIPTPSDAQPPITVMVLDTTALAALGQKLASDFQQYENDRKIAELRWMKNLRQRIGVYDPDIEAKLDPNRSKAYPKLTRVKSVSMLARLMHLLFSGGTKNWGVTASPVPNLSVEDLASVLQGLMDSAQQGAPITDEAIEAAVRTFAMGRAKNLETEIADQLTEIGGDRTVDYVALVRKVLMSGITYGMGVLKGPYAREQKQRRWQRSNNQLIPQEVDALVPQFDFCSLWDYYPDMSARYTHQMDGQFERQVLSRQQLRELADQQEPHFQQVILGYLKDNASGNYRSRPFETELRTLGPHINVPVNDGRKYEIIIWDGYLSGHYLFGCGVEVTEAQKKEQVRAVVWMLDGKVIRAVLNPWSLLNEPKIKSYHHFIFEEDDSSLVGEGLPQIMRDSQMGVCAAVRMVLDNGGVVCGPMLEVNTEMLTPGQDYDSIHAYKVLRREDTGVSQQYPAVREISIESKIGDLNTIKDMFLDFADRETFVSAQTGGDMSKSPSEPFRTATGASMMRGDAALPFKDVVRNFDQFTNSVFSALIAFNKHFNTKPSIKGDFQPVAMGSTSLIAKEVLGMQYDQLVQTLTDEEKLYIDWRKLLKARLDVRDMDNSVIVDDTEATRREQAQAAAQQAQAQQQAELMRAEVRKLLADAVKSLTQSGSNQAKGEAATYNAILGGLEKGVSPTDVAMARSTGEVPTGIAETQARLNPPKEAVAA